MIVKNQNYPRTVRQIILSAFGFLAVSAILSSQNNVQASTSSEVEAVAVVQVASGISNTYNLGLRFPSEPDCLQQISQINLVFFNLVSQGVYLGGMPISVSCKKSETIGIINVN